MIRKELFRRWYDRRATLGEKANTKNVQAQIVHETPVSAVIHTYSTVSFQQYVPRTAVKQFYRAAIINQMHQLTGVAWPHSRKVFSIF